jgi:hypothetical protein
VEEESVGFACEAEAPCPPSQESVGFVLEEEALCPSSQVDGAFAGLADVLVRRRSMLSRSVTKCPPLEMRQREKREIGESSYFKIRARTLRILTC